MNEGNDVVELCARIAFAFYRRRPQLSDHRCAQLPADLPARSSLAAAILGAIMRSGPQMGSDLLQEIDGSVAIAEANPPSTPEWNRTRAGAKAMALLSAAEQHRIPDVGLALREMDKLTGEIDDDPGLAALLDSVRMALTYMRALQEGDESAVQRCRGISRS